MPFDSYSRNLQCSPCSRFLVVSFPISNHHSSGKIESSTTFQPLALCPFSIRYDTRPILLFFAAFSTSSASTKPTNISAAVAWNSLLFTSSGFCRGLPSKESAKCGSVMSHCTFWAIIAHPCLTKRSMSNNAGLKHNICTQDPCIFEPAISTTGCGWRETILTFTVNAIITLTIPVQVIQPPASPSTQILTRFFLWISAVRKWRTAFP